MEILLTREQSSMASTWTEKLGTFKTPEGDWIIGNIANKILGSIYDLVEEDKLYDENGELKIPEFIDSQKIAGLEDGEYLTLDEYEFIDYPVRFTKDNFEPAIHYCEEYNWDNHKNYEQAIDTLKELLSK